MSEPDPLNAIGDIGGMYFAAAGIVIIAFKLLILIMKLLEKLEKRFFNNKEPTNGS